MPGWNWSSITSARPTSEAFRKLADLTRGTRFATEEPADRLYIAAQHRRSGAVTAAGEDGVRRPPHGRNGKWLTVAHGDSMAMC
jgi:hypothetical protein